MRDGPVRHFQNQAALLACSPSSIQKKSKQRKKEKEKVEKEKIKKKQSSSNLLYLLPQANSVSNTPDGSTRSNEQVESRCESVHLCISAETLGQACVQKNGVKGSLKSTRGPEEGIKGLEEASNGIRGSEKGTTGKRGSEEVGDGIRIISNSMNVIRRGPNSMNGIRRGPNSMNGIRRGSNCASNGIKRRSDGTSNGTRGSNFTSDGIRVPDISNDIRGSDVSNVPKAFKSIHVPKGSKGIRRSERFKGVRRSERFKGIRGSEAMNGIRVSDAKNSIRGSEMMNGIRRTEAINGIRESDVEMNCDGTGLEDTDGIRGYEGANDTRSTDDKNNNGCIRASEAPNGIRALGLKRGGRFRRTSAKNLNSFGSTDAMGTMESQRLGLSVNNPPERDGDTCALCEEETRGRGGGGLESYTVITKRASKLLGSDSMLLELDGRVTSFSESNSKTPEADGVEKRSMPERHRRRHTDEGRRKRSRSRSSSCNSMIQKVSNKPRRDTDTSPELGNPVLHRDQAASVARNEVSHSDDIACNQFDAEKNVPLILSHSDGSGSSHLLGQQPYIPGLDDQVALRCLAFVSLSDMGRLARVNKQYRDLVRTRLIYNLRRLYGVVEHWVFIFTSGPNGWTAYNPKHNIWKSLPEAGVDPMFNMSDRESLSAGTQVLWLGREAFDFVYYRYDLVTNQWEKGPPMPNPRWLFASASCGEFAFVAGGFGPEKSTLKLLNSAERYNSLSGQWEPLPPMSVARQKCSGFYMDDKFYVIGGKDANHEPIMSGEEYDPITRTWRTIEGMYFAPKVAYTYEPSPPLVAVVDNNLYAVDNTINILKVYDKERNVWKDLGQLPVRTDLNNGWGVAFKALGDRLFVMGGIEGIAAFTWRPTPGCETTGAQWQCLSHRERGIDSLLWNCAVMAC